MKKIKIKKNTIILIFALISVLLLAFFTTSYQDYIEYTKDEGEEKQKQKYSLINYPEDVFVYGFNNEDNLELEVEEITPIEHKLWDILWNEEDLYCEKSQREIVNEYYNDDVNYDWYFVLDTEDKEIRRKISLDESEIIYMKEIDDTEINAAIFFEEMDEFGSLLKISKDKLVYGITTLVKYKGSWYWKSDVISSDKEIVKPESEEQSKTDLKSESELSVNEEIFNDNSTSNVNNESETEENDERVATYVKPLPTDLNNKILKLEKEIKNGIK